MKILISPQASHLGILFSILAFLPTAHATLIVSSAEDPNSYTSTLSGVSVLDFNSLSTGRYTNYSWNTVGTIDSLYVINGDVFGGAGDTASKYSVQSVNSSLGGVSSTTITLNQPMAYFGLWWSAGDAGNRLIFKSGNTIVAQFTAADILNILPNTYDGNPRNRSQNSGETYAFLNFYGDAETTWDTITLTNTASSGFESDNWTVRAAAWGTQPQETGGTPGNELLNIEGLAVTVVPEPSIPLLSLMAAIPWIFRRRR